MLEKLCRECNTIKPVGQFHKRKGIKSGLASRCKECQSKRDKNRTDQARRKVTKHEWWTNNKEKSTKRHKEWLENNPDYPEKWYKNNKQRVKKTQLEYVETESGRWVRLKAGAKYRKIHLNLTYEKFLDITSHKCYYCGEFTEGKFYCGIDRVDSSKGYTEDNIVPCCEMCNRMKLDYEQQKFLEHCKKIAEHYKTLYKKRHQTIRKAETKQ